MSSQPQRFTITAKIRETAEAVLYRGYRREDTRTVLLKVPHGRRPTATQLARLRHEHALLCAIDAPSVVKPLGIEDLGDSVALVMEYAGDKSLDQLVGQEPVDLPTFLRTAAAMAEAIAAVHRQHVIHKDIKPHNFLRDAGTGAITLIEFGAATRLTVEDRRSRHVSRLEGTLAYMSPEQTGRMNRSVDRRTDLYSLGVTLYELATGTLPFPTADPLELLHSHIARSPMPLHMLRTDWPPMVSEIVMRLLAKNAEDRYQDISGLAADLARCQASLQASGTIAAFKLGEQDFSDELRLPQKLYGREAELASLQASFERACSGSAELLLVSGYSGVGKSVLVGELQKQLGTGAHFASGKFDPIGRRVPYAPIIQGCGELLRSLLAEPPAGLARWREKLLTAVGSNGRVVADIIPELTLVLGEQPPVEALDPAPSQHRFEATFLSFLQVFASAEHPLVFFLDDLQWADAASLRILQLLLTANAAKQGFLLVIGAFRDNEVDPAHPLTGAIAELRQAGVRIVDLKLRPLDEAAVRRLLGDTFAMKEGGLAALAEVALEKTQGNPFFLGQFLTGLHRDGLIAFAADSRRWTFDLPGIQAATVTDNVVDYVVGRLQRLPQATQDLLRLAACIGHQFDRRTLALIAEFRVGQVKAALWPALREGLVVPLEGGQAFLHETAAGAGEGDEDARDDAGNPAYRFLHDRVQQAAYATLAEGQRREMHLRIGRLRLAGAGSAMEDRQLFEIVNHLDLGAELITDADERRALARLNYTAARRAKDAAAHATAIRHLDVCLGLLGESAGPDDYETAFQAEICRAECEIATGHFGDAFRALDRADAIAREDIDRATALALRTLALVSTNRMGEAIECGVRAARVLGMDFPGDAAAIGPAIGAEFGAIFATLGPRGIEGLLDLPPMTDRKSLLLLHVLHRIMPAAAQINPPLMTLIVARAVHLSLREGNAPVSAYFCAAWAHVQVVMGEVQKAYAIGQIALRLNERIGSQAIACANQFVLGAFVIHWSRSLQECLEHLRQGLKAAMAAGDYLYLCYCAMADAATRFWMGDALDNVVEAADAAASYALRAGDLPNQAVIHSLLALANHLLGRPEAAGSTEDAETNRKMVESDNPFVTSSHFLFLAVEKYLAGDGAGATACLTRAKPSVPGNIAGPHTRFFEALLHAEQARAGGPGAAAALAELEADEAQFGQWASLSPRTFGYLHALVAAELCASTGDDRQALTWYEQASKLARDERSLLHEALANELAGEHAERLGWERIAQHHYFENASAAYARWGAARKAAHVAARIREPLEHQRSAPVDPQDTHGTGHVRTDSFDAIALAKATQAISGEIVLSRLMARLMQIAIEQAGAERGFLLLLRNGELWVECAAGSKADSFKRFRFDSAGPAVTPATATRETPVSLPHAIVDFVLQAREKVLLTRAARPGRFSSDPYVGRHRPQSILCMPLIRQGELIGLLYLENRLTADVFHDDQVQLLEMLSTQAAISLENARLYEELEERVRDRTRRLEDSLRTIQENQAKIIEAERRAAVAHLESELAIAQRIQTSILPRELSVAGMEIAAAMATATEVGGDYYDILPTQDGGCWLGIGDVCGHGLNAGLVMLMVQSGLASLMRSDAWVDPATLLCLLNRAVYDNVHRRLERDDYATLALFRFFPEGRFLFAGAHEDILIWRSCSQQCERIETLGTWIGARQDIESQTKSREGRLAEGDVMVLYTDGIVEARRANREQFGIGRTTTIVEQQHAQPAAEICRRLLDQAQAWAVEREDDQTVVVVRRGARR